MTGNGAAAPAPTAASKEINGKVKQLKQRGKKAHQPGSLSETPKAGSPSGLRADSALADPRFQTAQKQAAAVEMGRARGNLDFAAQMAKETAATAAARTFEKTSAPEAAAQPSAGVGVAAPAAAAMPASKGTATPAGIAERIHGQLEQMDGVTRRLGGVAAADAARPEARYAPVVAALGELEADERRQVEIEYQDRYGIALRAALRARPHYSSDALDLLRTAALLNGATSIHEDAVEAAMALHVLDYVSYEELFRILYKFTVQGRQNLQQQYHRLFPADVLISVGIAFQTTGYLRGDAAAVFGRLRSEHGWVPQKLDALLDHDLCDAEEIYFDSVGIYGTNDAPIVARVRRLWSQGPEQITKLFENWDRYVRNESGWTGRAWTSKPLNAALLGDVRIGRSKRAPAGFEFDLTIGELSGDAERVVQAIFDAHEAFTTAEGHAGDDWKTETRPSEGSWRQQEVERAQLRVARELWNVSEAEQEGAAATIQAIRQAQIERAKDQPDRQKALIEAREQEKRDLLQQEALYQSDPLSRRLLSDGRKSKLARLRAVLEGPLQPADDFFFASNIGDAKRMVEIAKKTWAEDTLATFLDDARHERRASSLDSRSSGVSNSETIRPAYSPLKLSGMDSVTKDLDLRLRLVWLLLPGLNRPTRGAQMLKLEFDGIVGDNAALKAGVALLQMPGVDSVLRDATIAAYVKAFVPSDPLNDPGQSNFEGSYVEYAKWRFIAYTRKRFHSSIKHRSIAQVDLEELLGGPSQSLDEIAGNARQREAASHTGLIDNAAEAGVRAFAPQRRNWVEESLARLRWMSEREKTHPRELEVLAAMSGVNSVLELGQVEYGLFKARLNELRAAKELVGEAIAFLMEGWGRSVLVALLGATGVGSLAAAVIAFLGGMLARKGVAGEDYDFVTLANAGTIASEFTTYGIDEILKLEPLLLKALPATKFAALFRIVTPGRADIVAKLVQEIAKTAISRALEKGTSNLIEGKGLDGFGKLMTSSFVFGSLKTYAGTKFVKPTYFTELTERLEYNVKKVMVGGPPPKASLANATVSALYDLALEPTLADMTGPERLSFIGKKYAQALYLDVGVGMAFTYLQNKEAMRARAMYERNEDGLATRASADAKVTAAYDNHVKQRQGAGQVPDGFNIWLAANPVIVTAFLADAIKEIDAKGKGDAVAPAAKAAGPAGAKPGVNVGAEIASAAPAVRTTARASTDIAKLLAAEIAQPHALERRETSTIERKSPEKSPLKPRATRSLPLTEPFLSGAVSKPYLNPGAAHNQTPVFTISSGPNLHRVVISDGTPPNGYRTLALFNSRDKAEAHAAEIAARPSAAPAAAAPP